MDSVVSTGEHAWSVSSAVQIVSEALDAFNRADRDRLGEMVHPSFEVVSPLSDARGQPYKGAQGARDWGDDMIENFASIAASISSLEEVKADRVLATGTAKVRGRASGLDYKQPLGLLVDVRDGRIARVQVFFNPDEAKRLARETAGG
jgi:ketosteroid isomerase-like protein